jgi:WD40 repeat protein
VIEALAKRAGQRCSNPGCRQQTSGPSADPAKAIVVGVASHITAASPGGPRYDSLLSMQERRAPTNGIWLCQTCARMIDVDIRRFTTTLLRHWKTESEASAMRALAVPNPAIGSSVAALEAVLSGHTNFAWDVVVTPDGRRAVSASNDHTVHVWDLQSHLPLMRLTGHRSIVCSVAVSRDGHHIAAGAYDGRIIIWNQTDGSGLFQLNHGASDAKVAWLSDGRLLTGGADGSLVVWRGSQILDKIITAHSGPVLRLVGLANPNRALSVSSRWYRQVVESGNGRVRNVFFWPQWRGQFSGRFQ